MTSRFGACRTVPRLASVVCQPNGQPFGQHPLRRCGKATPARSVRTLFATCLALFLGQVDALSPMVGRPVTRYGPRLSMTAGMASMGLGMLIEVAFVIVGTGPALNTGPVVGVALPAVGATNGAAVPGRCP